MRQVGLIPVEIEIVRHDSPTQCNMGCSPELLDVTVLILRPLDQLLLNLRTFMAQKLFDGGLGMFVFLWGLETFQRAEIAFQGVLERGDGKLWKLRLIGERASDGRVELELCYCCRHRWV